MPIIDLSETARRLIDHLTMLTVTIGERSMFSAGKLAKTAEYIESAYAECGLPVQLEDYPCRDFTARNVVALSKCLGAPAKRFLVGAHYDCILGTVGADDNASAVAVQLELARQLHKIRKEVDIPVSVKFVSFALEEYPSYGTSCMGSRVHAKAMKARGEALDGMICLEMVGCRCLERGCQKYPILLRMRGYPEEGNFISVVGNCRSRKLLRDISRSFAANPHLPVQALCVPLNGWILPAVRLSDHASFWNEGFKAVMVTDTAFFRNRHYHLPSDSMEKLDYDFMAQLVESMVIFFMSFQKGGA
ncbi:MAG: M28 family peptidase [Syntrophobacteraceae bacterium]